MKAGREHRVQLSPRAVSILRQVEKLKAGEFVFPGRGSKKTAVKYGHGDGATPDEDRRRHGSRFRSKNQPAPFLTE